MADGSTNDHAEDKARYGTFDILADGAELAIRAFSTSRARLPKVAKPGKSATSTRASSTKANQRARRPTAHRSLAQVEALASSTNC